MRLNLALFAVPLVAVACVNPAAPSARPAVVVTNVAPGTGSSLLIEYEFHNTTRRPLYLMECGGNVFTLVSVKEPGGDIDNWGTICLGIWVVNRIPVQAGARYRATKAVAVRLGAIYLLTVQYLTDSTATEAELVRAPAVRFPPGT